MKIYKKKGWEKPSLSVLSVKSLTLGGDGSSNSEQSNKKTPVSS